MSLVFEAPPEPHPEPEQVRVPEPPVFVRTQAAETPKIIEFPKPAPQVEELAEPVLDLPRILEAEEEPPAPAAALPPMTLEDEDDNAPGLVAEFDLPLQVASMSQRSFAAMVDWLVVLMASAVFLMIFVKIADALPHSRIALGIGLLVPCFFWGVYHYLFLVHAAATPGMQMAELSLQTFEGEPVKRSLRRWRALALVVSCMSVGLGFVWAVVDEDALCWHDRITRTYAVRQ